MVSEHKHAGSRKGARKPPAFSPQVLALAVAVTASVVAWGYLVYLAIDFGTSARGGETQAWWFLGVASLGAIVCLFLGLILVSRLLRAIGITEPPADPLAEPPESRPTGRRRASS
ncbi:MAG: hypothetical protein ACR2JD_02560 [Nocardioides sp.]